MMVKHKILELFSGIGGMHYAWNASELDGEIIAAVDINTLANTVYSHNFKKDLILNRNIQSLSPEFIISLSPDVILMSPPCQPFTRNGLKKDSEDARSCAFIHILSILKHLTSIKYILMENVKGFEDSDMRDMFVKALQESEYFFQEFLLSPTQFGIPNSRLRYYCLARKKFFSLVNTNQIMTTLPSNKEKECYPISEILEKQIDDVYNLPQKYFKRAAVLDICHSDARRSCCFTKGYTHFLEGTGSVFTKASKEDVQIAFEKCNNLNNDSSEYNEIVSSLKLRFFSPKEVSRLMAFPETFMFPKETTNKQCYRLLGNSINVTVVSELLKYLIDE